MDDIILRNIIQSLYGTYTIAIESTSNGIKHCEELKARIQKTLDH
jgi:hypothetical protein